MHEMGIAMEIMEIAISSIPDELKGVPVAKVNLAVGKLAAIVPDSLKFCFEVAAKDTALEGAELIIDDIPVEALCKDCGNRWHIDTAVFTCPKCESGALEILSGRELDIVSIEMAEDDEETPEK
jgi:hydrogenase nickel incorporation protein HypA/HybF